VNGNSSTNGGLILIADDDPDILDLVRFRLAQEGYETMTATNGEEALDLARERPPDVCVLDVMMPKLNGFEVVQAMRTEEPLSKIPVLMLTATVQGRDIERGFAVGADDYLRKPFNPQELRARVAALLKRSSVTKAPAVVGYS
jgi:DNA-binding response OmpR family regulator